LTTEPGEGRILPIGLVPVDPDSERGRRMAEGLSQVMAEALDDLIRAGKPLPACFLPDPADDERSPEGT
jgi:hypothetical protein